MDVREAESHISVQIELREKSSYFRHPLIKTVYRLYRSRVRERQHIGPQAHDIAVFPVQVDVRPLGFPASDVEVPPPVGVACQWVPGVFVQTIVEFVPGQTQYHTDHEDNRPVGLDQWKELAGQHVEVLLAFGGVEKRDGGKRLVVRLREIRGGVKREVHVQ